MPKLDVECIFMVMRRDSGVDDAPILSGVISKKTMIVLEHVEVAFLFSGSVQVKGEAFTSLSKALQKMIMYPTTSKPCLSDWQDFDDAFWILYKIQQADLRSDEKLIIKSI